MIFIIIMILVSLSINVPIIIYLIQNERNKKKRYTIPGNVYIQTNQKYPYHKVELLTANERNFYNNLKSITVPNGIDILTKIRLADLINVNQEINRADYLSYFSKISSKHVDFALSRNMNIIAIIELDDKSHWRRDRQERDQFLNNALSKCGYTLIRTTGALEPIINELKRQNIL